MNTADVIQIGKQLLSRAVYFKDANGREVRPIFQRDAATGVRSYRVYPVGNSKSTHVEVFDARELAEYASQGFAIRCRLHSGQSSNRSLHSKDIAGRLVVLSPLGDVNPDNLPSKTKRFPAEQLRAVTADFVWSAVQDILAGIEVSGFGPSTDYDLIVDGDVRLAPKHVFGLAASKALGKPVQASDFSGGVGTVCFELLEAAGYQIVSKDEPATLSRIERDGGIGQWAEGDIKIISHLRKERARGLAEAKKADFLKKHGKLFCEACFLDPVKEYGHHGVACIEVHHYETQLADMKEGHVTLLEHLKCLCANCHRIEHRRLRNEKNHPRQ